MRRLSSSLGSAAFLIAALVSIVNCRAGIIIYTSEASFLPNVAPGALFEDFSVNFSGVSYFESTKGAFSYSAYHEAGFYGGRFLGTSDEYQDISINFLSGNVTAFGGNFFAVSPSDNLRQNFSVSLTLSDGTREIVPSTNVAGYRGFVSDVPITSLILHAPRQNGFYGAMDNFTVGTITAVPEPSSMLLLGVAGVGGLAWRRTRKGLRALR